MLIIQKLADSEKVLNTMLYLENRWRDESKYENIDDYRDVLQKSMPRGVNVVRINKKPFMAIVQIGGMTYDVITRNKGRGVYCLAYRMSKRS